MMVKKCSNFHLRGFNFIETVYELFDNPSNKLTHNLKWLKKNLRAFYNNASPI